MKQPDRESRSGHPIPVTAPEDLSVIHDEGTATGLMAHHRQLLIDRGLTEQVIAARGYSSGFVSKWLHDVAKLSNTASKQVPGLVIPVHDARGEPAFYAYRPDHPREDADGRPIKYETPTSQRNSKVSKVLDVPLLCQATIQDETVPLWVTEGPIKADAIASHGGTAVGTFGVWGWKGAGVMRPDWDNIRLKGRTVYLAPDSDVASNRSVAQAITRLGQALESRGADVRYCYVPATAKGAKQGVDDYLARGGTLDGLMETADDEPPYGSQAPGGNVAATLFRGADDRFTDARMAETVAGDVLADRFIWVSALGWLTWDGRHWGACSDVTVGEAVRSWTLEQFKAAVGQLQAGKGDQAALDGWRSMLQAGKEAAVIKLARGIVERQADHLDADPDLINTPDGVVDPRTLETRPHDPALLMTRITSGSYRPGFTHPDWEQAQEALPAEERAWIQTRVGQAMTGHRTPDGRLVVLQGSGENGKGVMFTDGAVPALGDYAGMASAKLFKAGEHSEEMASLRGKRLLVAEELAEGRSIDVAAMKRVQDVGRITARHVYQQNMSFQASHSLFTTTNYLPVVNEVDHGTWRRLVLVRFPYTFRKAHELLQTPNDRRGDERLKARIEANESGQHDAIVTWAVEGAHAWYVNGPLALAPTAKIESDTLAWRMEADRILGYWAECLIPDRDAMVLTTELRDDFNVWLRTNGHNEWPKELFGPRFIQHAETVKHGVDQVRTGKLDGLSHRAGIHFANQPKQAYVYRGVRFRTDADEAVEGPPPGNLPTLLTSPELSLERPYARKFPEGQQGQQVGTGHGPDEESAA
jgi:putative DNA primase/helicase